MYTDDDSAEKLSSEQSAKLGANENKTPATTSEGEYTEEKKAVMSAMKSHYKDEEITDENYTGKLETMVAKDLLPKAEKLGKYNESNERMMAMMESEPELGGILSDMSRGGKFTKVLPKYVDLGALSPDEDDEEEWEENVRTRESNYASSQSRKAEIAANEEKSAQVIEQFVTEKELDGENAAKFGDMLTNFLDRAYAGEITKEFLDAMYYYMNRDNELQAQRQVGEMKAKNEKISQTFMKDSEIYKGDKLPSLDGSGAVVTTGIKDPVASKLDQHLDSQQSILQGR